MLVGLRGGILRIALLLGGNAERFYQGVFHGRRHGLVTGLVARIHGLPESHRRDVGAIWGVEARLHSENGVEHDPALLGLSLFSGLIEHTRNRKHPVLGERIVDGVVEIIDAAKLVALLWVPPVL